MSIERETPFSENIEYTHIPVPFNAGEVANWRTVEIRECEEQLVPIGPFSQEAGSILTSSVYYGEHNNSPYIHDANKLEGSLLSVFMREGVAKRLLEAQQYLPENHRLLVFDAYRPLEVQESLFYLYRQQLHSQEPGLNEESLTEETQKYVSIPSTNPSRPSPHNTGGSVDLAIIKLPPEQATRIDFIDSQLADNSLNIEDKVALEMQKYATVRHHSQLLNFGTAFDHGGEKAAMAYFEKQTTEGVSLSSEEIEARKNRRLLYGVMEKVGMQAYEAEWWHFNAPESQMGAVAAGLEIATYGTAVLDKDNAAHETLRKEIYDEAIRLQEEKMSFLGETAMRSKLEAKIASTLDYTGEPRLTGYWPTEIIAPQSP